jgi:hypothetical protein
VKNIKDVGSNFRHKFILQQIKKLKRNHDKLTEWEKGFLESVEKKSLDKISTNEYNRLQEIASGIVEYDR